MDKKTMKVLASDKKREILKILSGDQFTLSDISKKLGLSVSTAKEHLDDLCDAGLIEQKDEGRKWKYYVLTKRGKSLLSPFEKKILLMLGITAISVLGSSWMMLSKIMPSETESTRLMAGSVMDYSGALPSAQIAEAVALPYFEIVTFSLSILALGICIGYALNRSKIRN